MAAAGKTTTTRRSTRTRAAPAPDPLTADVARFLLLGPRIGTVREGSAARRVWRSGRAETVKLWKAHEVWLRAEAVRQHIHPAWRGGTLFYGEAAATPPPADPFRYPRLR